MPFVQTVNLPRGFAYVEFKSREEAEKARLHMDGGQLDGNVLRCRGIGKRNLILPYTLRSRCAVL